MSDTHKGRIYVCTDVGDDTHNCTLRMHKALNESSLIMAYDRVKVTKFMKALTEKVKFVKDELNQ